MPDTSPASDAGAGAEALLGLAAGHQVRLPSLTSLPNASKTDPASLRTAQLQHHFHPTPPPLQLPEHHNPSTASQIPHLPPPSTTLLPTANDRLPTISEWTDPSFRTLPPPSLHPLPSTEQHPDRWKVTASLPIPYAYPHSHSHHWQHPRSNPYSHPLPQSYFYYSGQPAQPPAQLHPPPQPPSQLPQQQQPPTQPQHPHSQTHSQTHAQTQPHPRPQVSSHTQSQSHQCSQPIQHPHTQQHHTLPPAYNLPSHQMHTSLPPPLVLPVPRSDTSTTTTNNNSNKSLPPVSTIQSIPVLNHIRVPAVSKTSTANKTPLPSLGVALPSTAGCSLQLPPAIPVPLFTPSPTTNCLPSAVTTVSEPSKPTSRRKAIADLINPTDSPPTGLKPVPVTISVSDATVSKTTCIEAPPKVERQLHSTQPLKERTSSKADEKLSSNYATPLSSSDRSIQAQGATQETCGRLLNKLSQTTDVSRPSNSSPKPTDGASVSSKSDHKPRKLSPSIDRQRDDRERKDRERDDGERTDRERLHRERINQERVNREREGRERERRESMEKKETSSEDSNSNSQKEDSGESDVIRCPCGKNVNSGTMIACDGCNTWQHCKCMGYKRSEITDDIEYYCEQCRPKEMRIGCIAHPKYKERYGKDREGKDTKMDTILCGVKPTELRRLFAADMKQKKVILKGSKDCVISKYAAIMRSQYPKHRNSLIEGLFTLLDTSRNEISQRLDCALRKLRQEKEAVIEKSETVLEKKKIESSLSEEIVTENNYPKPNQNVNGRSSVKRHRVYSSSTDQWDVPTLKGDLSPSVELPGNIEMNDQISIRGMSREERKLLAEMRLFKRMEERERERKRPRIGEVGQSPRAGHPPRPKTPRNSNSRITSPRSMLHSNRESDERKSRLSNEKQGRHLDDSRRTDPMDGAGSHSTKVIDKDDRGDSPDKMPKIDLGKSSTKALTQTSRAEVETPREVARRERHRLERQMTRRRDAIESSSLHRQRQGSIFERNRSHESRRRRAQKDGRLGKDFKRDPILDVVIHVPGPSVLGSKLVPKRRVASLVRAEAEEDKEYILRMEEGSRFPFPKKNKIIRKDHQPWKEMIADACPAKKRYREPFLEIKQAEERIEEKVQKSEPAQVSVSMVVVSQKDQLPDQGKKLESRLVTNLDVLDKKHIGKWKDFCLKKRMTHSAPTLNAETITDKNVGKISPVSPNPNTSSSPPINKRIVDIKVEKDVKLPKYVITPTPTSPIISSPLPMKLRSSPMPSPTKPYLRSAPVALQKRARSPTQADARSSLETTSNGKDKISPPETCDMLVKSSASTTITVNRKIAQNNSSSTDITIKKEDQLSNEKAGNRLNEANLQNLLNSTVKESPPLLPENGSEFLRSRLVSSRDPIPEAGLNVDNQVRENKRTNYNGLGSANSSTDNVKRGFCIPLSKPVPSVNGMGGIMGSLGLRSKRPGTLTSVSKKGGNISNVQQETNTSSTKPSELNSSDGSNNVIKKEESTVKTTTYTLEMNGASEGGSINDFLEQRLEAGASGGGASAPVTPTGSHTPLGRGFSTVSGVGPNKRIHSGGNGIIERRNMNGPVGHANTGVLNGIEKRRGHGYGVGGMHPRGSSFPTHGLVRNVTAPNGYRGSKMTEGKVGPWSSEGSLPSFAHGRGQHRAFHAGRLSSMHKSGSMNGMHPSTKRWGVSGSGAVGSHPYRGDMGGGGSNNMNSHAAGEGSGRNSRGGTGGGGCTE